MSTINISPASTLSRKILPSTGTHSDVLAGTNGIYTSSLFLSGAVDALKLAYQTFVGNILDIELQPSNIYMAYENAVTKYSYFINAHQAQNVLYDVLGFTTASFDQFGNVTAGESIATKYPNFTLGYARNIAQAFGGEIGLGGVHNQYSASISLVDGVQDYDLNAILLASSYSGTVEGKQINIKDIYFRTRQADWSFFSMFGGGYAAFGIGGYGSFSNYANSSMFRLYPTWQTKLEAMAYEDALWTRTAHYSFTIINNKLRLFPIPKVASTTNNKIWFTFQVQDSPWSGSQTGSATNGINNLNNIPLSNLPYDSINAVGKQWIRDYFLALVAERLSWSRGKTDTIPIANGPVKLNSNELMSWASQEKQKLEQELKDYLDKTAYAEITRRKKEAVDDAMSILAGVPSLIWMR